MVVEESFPEMTEIIDESGSREAFDALITRIEGKVLKTAVWLTRNHADAQDVAQEVYIKVFRSLAACKDMERFDAWVYRITVNTARDFARRKKLFLPLTGAIRFLVETRHALSPQQPRDPVLREEIRTRLAEALDLLTFNERAAFIFKALEEMETSEVAAILGCREVTVRSYVHEARKKLQKHFRDFRDTLWTD
jgi:RNA polymerase sigma-70 factor (ECF subfamily)